MFIFRLFPVFLHERYRYDLVFECCVFFISDFILYGLQVPSHFDRSGMLRQTGKRLVRTRPLIPPCSVPIATSTAIPKGREGDGEGDGEGRNGGEGRGGNGCEGRGGNGGNGGEERGGNGGNEALESSAGSKTQSVNFSAISFFFHSLL